MLAMGYSVEQTFSELHKPIAQAPPVNTDDFEAALAHEDSQRRFHVVADALELAEILKAPLEKWRVFLHPSQRRLVQMQANGLRACPWQRGTGKTVVAMHRAKFLSPSRCSTGPAIRFCLPPLPAISLRTLTPTSPRSALLKSSAVSVS